jgi:hypothetical protein
MSYHAGNRGELEGEKRLERRREEDDKIQIKSEERGGECGWPPKPI